MTGLPEGWAETSIGALGKWGSGGTPKSDNKLFYGTVIGKANMNISGPMYDMTMDISGEPTDSSRVYIATGASRESAEADFIVWKEYGKEMEGVLELLG